MADRAVPDGGYPRVFTVGALIALATLVTVALVFTLGGDDPEDGATAAETEPPSPTVPNSEADTAPEVDAALDRPAPWVAFSELPGDWRYQDFFSTPLEPHVDNFFGETDQGHIGFLAANLDELQADDFAHFVARRTEEGDLDFAALQGPLPFDGRGGIEGAQWWGQFPEFEGGKHFSLLAVDLGSQIVLVQVTYNEGSPGVLGQPTRDEVGAWMRTIRIDPAEVRAVLPAN